MGRRLAVLACGLVAAVVASRVLVERVLPHAAAATQMFVQMLAIAAVYGAVAWRGLTMVSQRRRPDQMAGPLVAAPLVGGQVNLVPARVPVRTVNELSARRPAGARHLTLVPRLPD